MGRKAVERSPAHRRAAVLRQLPLHVRISGAQRQLPHLVKKQRHPCFKYGTHKEVLRHSISDVRSEVLWCFY